MTNPKIIRKKIKTARPKEVSKVKEEFILTYRKVLIQEEWML